VLDCLGRFPFNLKLVKITLTGMCKQDKGEVSVSNICLSVHLIGALVLVVRKSDYLILYSIITFSFMNM
jgi:hypothetical protein